MTKKTSRKVPKPALNINSGWMQVIRYSYRRSYSDFSNVPYNVVLNNGGSRIRAYKSAGHFSPLNVATGWRAPTPYAGYMYQDIAGYVDLVATDVRSKVPTRNGIAIEGFPFWTDYSTVPAIPGLTSLKTELTNQCIEKIAGADANLAVGWAERQKTLDMCGGLLRKAAYIVRRRGHRPRREGRRGERFIDNWLEFQYGITPTLLDLFGCAQAAEDLMVNRPPRITASASRHVPISNSTTTTRASIGSLSWVCDKITSLSVAGGVKMRMDAAVNNPHVRTLQQVGLLNPLTFAWELIPYSFVIDWVVNIGEYVGQLSAFAGLGFLGTCTTTYWTRQCEIYYGGNVAQPVPNPAIGYTGVRTVNCTPFKHESSGFDRTVSFSTPSVQLVLKNPLNLKHFADGLALFQGAARRDFGVRYDS